MYCIPSVPRIVSGDVVFYETLKEKGLNTVLGTQRSQLMMLDDRTHCWIMTLEYVASVSLWYLSLQTCDERLRIDSTA